MSPESVPWYSEWQPDSKITFFKLRFYFDDSNADESSKLGLTRARQQTLLGYPTQLGRMVAEHWILIFLAPIKRMLSVQQSQDKDGKRL